MKTVLTFCSVIFMGNAMAWDNADQAVLRELNQLNGQMQYQQAQQFYQQQIETQQYNQERAANLRSGNGLDANIILQGQQVDLNSTYYYGR